MGHDNEIDDFDDDDDAYISDDFDDELDSYAGLDLVRQNFSGVDLSQHDMSNANLRRANLTSAILCETNFSDSVLALADLSYVNASLADMQRADLHRANLIESDLTKVDLSHSNLTRANLQKANLDGADLTKAVLRRANLREANLAETNLDNAELKEASLTGANLRGATLYGANLCKADLRKTDMSGLDLSNLKLNNANLGGAELIKTNLAAADMSGAILNGATLYKANLNNARLCRASLKAANLNESDLNGADLLGASLLKADLTKAIMKNAILIAADLNDINLGNADLRGANLSGAFGKISNRFRCRIDLETYQRSGWGANNLADWHLAGAAIENFDQFPSDVQAAILQQREGLTLYFSTRLTPVDRFLIDGTIFGILGKDTDCQVVEFLQREDSAIVRLQAAHRKDLETIAEALYLRVWENHKRSQETALTSVNNLLGVEAYRQLSNLRQRLDYLELQLDRRQAWHWDFRQDRMQISRPMRLFISHAPEDLPIYRELEGHLAVLRRQGVIETWHEGSIIAGSIRESEIHTALDAADVVIMLLSSDFLKSDDLEAQKCHALTRSEVDQTRIIPVIVRPVDLVGTGLEKYTPLPSDGRPVTRWADRDDAWSDVADGIRRAVMSLAGHQNDKPERALKDGEGQ